jgi:hypothetical protein
MEEQGMGTKNIGQRKFRQYLQQAHIHTSGVQTDILRHGRTGDGEKRTKDRVQFLVMFTTGTLWVQSHLSWHGRTGDDERESRTDITFWAIVRDRGTSTF